MSSLLSAQLHPGRALGFLVLGASLHDILTRIKAEPQRFPKIDLIYSRKDPIQTEVMVGLPENGLRLRFDGPEQRLRLIEVLDFTKNHIFLKPANDKERDLVRPPPTAAAAAAVANTTSGPNHYSSPPPQPPDTAATAGPTFRHIYQRFLGPTYDGEFVPLSEGSSEGKYVLSYPGVAFLFPMRKSDYSPEKDMVSLLSSTSVAASMAVFSGDSWAQARETLWTEVLPSIKTFAPLVKGTKDISPDEVSLVKIHGAGELQLFRKWTSSNFFWITLGETTPQQLVMALGPPDAIYHKNEQGMYIHKLRTASNTMARPNGHDLRRQEDLTDTDQSSTHTSSDAYDSNDEAVDEDMVENVSGECFYNYFYHGFDILVSTPTPPSRTPPSQEGQPAEHKLSSASPDRLVATKMVLHGNVPGSYPFNRHRRCRWEISYLQDQQEQQHSQQGQPSSQEASQPTGASPAAISSETAFSVVEDRLRDEWKSIYASEADARQQQRGMVLNRGWGDSPGSSCELLGGWEEGAAGGGATPGAGPKNGEESTTTLYGFPGLVFEVLKNGYVSALTVF